MYTRDGICYDLNKSIYKSTQNGVTFVFSSKLYKEKFESKLKEHRENINKSLSNRFRISIDVSTLADVVLYMKIEKRGFLIEAKDEKLQCRSHLQFVGGASLGKISYEK